MESIFTTEKEFVAVTAFYALNLPEFHMDMHSHKSYEIMYVTKGVCTVFCDHQEISLKQNQFIFIAPSIPHRLEVSPGNPCSILNLEFQACAKETPLSLSALFEKSKDFPGFWKSLPSFLVANDLRSMGYAVKDVISHLQKNSSTPDFLLCVLFYRMFLELSYCAQQKKKQSGMEYLKKACHYIDTHLLEDLSIPDIAAYVGINKSYLQLLFSQTMNCTIGTYINQQRLKQAVFLLTNSSLKITDIAFSSGYNSRQHFAYTFEKFYGISPSRYRDLHSRNLNVDTEKSYMKKK